MKLAGAIVALSMTGLLGLACTGGDEDAAAPVDASPSSVLPNEAGTPSQDAGPSTTPDAPPGPPITLTRSVHDGSANRTYVVHLPGDYATRTIPAQVVVAFHPARSSGAGFDAMTKLHEAAGAEDVVVAYPDGAVAPTGHRAWNAGFCCTRANDVAFFDAIVKDLSSLTTIEPKIAVTGYSSGAMMVYRLLCDRSAQISAAAPFAGYLREEDLASAVCPWSIPVPLLHIHGAEDTQMDPDGQPDGYYPGSGLQTPPLVDYMNLVATRNGGAPPSAPAVSTTSAELDSPVTQLGPQTAYVIIDGLGHTWPGLAATAAYGPGRTDLEGTAAVMGFLLRR